MSKVWAISDDFIRLGDRLKKALDLESVDFLNFLLVRKILDLLVSAREPQGGREPKTCGQIVGTQ